MARNHPDPWAAAAGDPFSAAADAARVEDHLCRQALKAAGVAPGAVHRLAGTAGRHAPLTFAALKAAVDFPVLPAVTGDRPDDPLTLMADYRRSRLWQTWVAVWDLSPGVRPGERVLAFKGPGWGAGVVHDARPPDRPHLRTGPPGRMLVVEAFVPWVQSLMWAPADDHHADVRDD